MFWLFVCPDWGVMVRQSFPLQGRGDAGPLQDPTLSKELSRIITSEGAVIRHMKDGSIEVKQYKFVV